jgi:hypothetical protein
MKRRALALFASLVLLGLVPGWALATTTVLDQSAGFTIGKTFGGGTYSLAQTFVAGKTGKLTAVDLYMAGTGTITATLTGATGSSGVPSGSALATKAVTLNSSGGWIHFAFPTPHSVTSGHAYAIVFSTGNLAWIGGSASNYSRGRALISISSMWEYLPTEFPGTFGDYSFRTYVAVTPPAKPKPAVVAPTVAPTLAPTDTPAPSAVATDTPAPTDSSSALVAGATGGPAITGAPGSGSGAGAVSGSGGSGASMMPIAAGGIGLLVLLGGLGFLLLRRRRTSDAS